MRSILFLLAIVLFLSSCRNKKIEPEAVDTVKVDTTVVAATQLAFSPLDNYELKKSAQLPDSINFLILASQTEFDNAFGPAKTDNIEVPAPDFIINHTVAVALLPTQSKTAIEIEKVELGESTINVFVKITKGEKETTPSSPARVFAIEKRDGVTGMDFYVNNQLVKSLMLPAF